MNILGIRELTIDGIINNNLEDIFYGGGGTAHNVIWNLLNTGNNLFIGGICGKSSLAYKEIEILNAAGINTDFLDIRRKNVRKVFTEIKEESETKNHVKCLKCNKDVWTSSAKYRFDKNLLEEHKIDIIIFDAFKNENNDIAKYAKEKGILTVLDWGTIGNLRYFSKAKMESLSENPYQIIQMNKRTKNFFLKRLELETNMELFEFLNVEFLILTSDEEGTTIITNDEEKNICFDVKEVLDNNGAGDATLSSFIIAYIETEYIKNRNFNKMIDVFAELSERKVTNVLITLGSRSGYPYFKHELNEILEKDKCNLCLAEKNIKDKKIKNKRRKFKIETSVGQILKRFENGISNKNINKTRSFLEQIKENEKLLILGQGASYVAGSYISKIINDNTNILSYTIYLDEIYESPLIDKVENVLILSNSGTSPDVKRATRYLKLKSKEIYLFTAKEEVGDDSGINIISYYSNNWTRERGFISIEGIILPVSITLLAVNNKLNKDKLISKAELIKERSESKFTDVFKSLNIKDNVNIDLFYDNSSYEIALDLESKLIESSYARVILHEKKNFSHGRFSILKKNIPEFVIYLNYTEDRYEKKLVKYLKNKNILILYLANNYDKNKEYDVFSNIIEIQYFIKELSIYIERDLSDPGYDNLDASLYKHK